MWPAGHTRWMTSREVHPSSRVNTALTMLRGRGGRVTRARRAVLEVLDSTTDHLNADEIAERAAARAPGVHLTTVYRALSTLGDLRVVTHTHVGGSAAVYHLSTATQHDDELVSPHVHVQCTSCGVVLDVSADEVRPLATRLQRNLGFRLDPQHAAMLGTCANCQELESRT